MRKLLGSSLALSLLLVLSAALLPAQEDPEEPPTPAFEPSVFDTLMDRSDLGNTVQEAQSHYHSGHRHLERAMKLEEKLAEVEGDKRETAEKNVRKAYEAAAEEYLQAIRTDPEMLVAYQELGQSYRSLDKHAEAIQVYNKALEGHPGDAECIYGRGESFLELNYLREAATTWTELVESDPERAGELMASMKRWVEAKRSDPGELRPDAVETLAAWISQQETAAAGDSG